MRKISFLIMTVRRYDDVIRAVRSIINNIKDTNIDSEIIILINGGSFEYLKQKLNKTFDGSILKLIKLYYVTKNIGVSAGRNLLFKYSSGDILIFIDDDAEFISKNSVDEILHAFSQNKDIAAIAFKSIDKLGNPIMAEIPVNSGIDTIQFVPYFVGVGHAIRKDAITWGDFLYPDNLFYGMEEYYLSYRLIASGWKILYHPKIVVKHHKSSIERLQDDDYYVHLSSNKVYISFLQLDFLRFIIHYLLWGGWLIKKSKNKIRSFCLFNLRLIRLLFSTKSHYFYRLNFKAREYIVKAGGHIFY